MSQCAVVGSEDLGSKRIRSESNQESLGPWVEVDWLILRAFEESFVCALPPLPHPLPLHISAQAIVLCFAPLCSFA